MTRNLVHRPEFSVRQAPRVHPRPGIVVRLPKKWLLEQDFCSCNQKKCFAIAGFSYPTNQRCRRSGNWAVLGEDAEKTRFVDKMKVRLAKEPSQGLNVKHKHIDPTDPTPLPFVLITDGHIHRPA